MAPRKLSCHLCPVKLSSRSSLSAHLRKTHGTTITAEGLRGSKPKRGPATNTVHKQAARKQAARRQGPIVLREEFRVIEMDGQLWLAERMGRG